MAAGMLMTSFVSFLVDGPHQGWTGTGIALPMLCFDFGFFYQPYVDTRHVGMTTKPARYVGSELITINFRASFLPKNSPRRRN